MMLNSRVPVKYKLLPILAILYVVSPFDFLPDFIPMIGWADDLLVLILAICAFIGLSQKKNLSRSTKDDHPRDNKSPTYMTGNIESSKMTRKTNVLIVYEPGSYA